MSLSPSHPSPRSSDDGVNLLAALGEAVDLGAPIIEIGSDSVPSAILSAAEIYLLTHEWEQNRHEIANAAQLLRDVFKRIHRTSPDSSGQVVDGV